MVTVKTTMGFTMRCDRRDYIGRRLLSDGSWEPLIANTIAYWLRAADWAFDIGANIGFDALVMSTAVGAEGRVSAFEPSWLNLQTLIDNLRAKDAYNVELISVGLGDAYDAAMLSVGGKRGHSNLWPDNVATKLGQSVLVMPLAELLLAEPARRLRLAKLDIEGYEHKTLLGARSLLERIDAVICAVDGHFLRACGDSPQALFDLLCSTGFVSFCSEQESAGPWISGDESYLPSQIYSSGHQPFDALFLRAELVGEAVQRGVLPG